MPETEFNPSPSSFGSILLAFCGGALVGAVAGLLTAPKPGKEVWSDVSHFAGQAKDYVGGLVGRQKEEAYAGA